MRQLNQWLFSALLFPLCASAEIINLNLEGVMLDRSGGRTYGGGYTVLDLFEPGDAFSIALKIDTNALAVIDSSMYLGDIPREFSLLGGPGYLPGYGECFEGPECIQTLEPYGADSFEVVEVIQQNFSLVKTLGASNQVALNWDYGASFDNHLPPELHGYYPAHGNLSSSLSFSFRDIAGESFQDIALGGPVAYAGGGVDSGALSIFSTQNITSKDIWSFDYRFDITRVSVSPVAAVPEASTWAMLVAGIALIGWRLREAGALLARRQQYQLPMREAFA